MCDVFLCMPFSSDVCVVFAADGQELIMQSFILLLCILTPECDEAQIMRCSRDGAEEMFVRVSQAVLAGLSALRLPSTGNLCFRPLVP